MFKLGYQAFMMMGVSSAYIVIRIVTSNSLKVTRKIFTIPYLLLATFFLLLVGIYPYFAISSYYGNLQTYKGLDGLAYFRDLYREDYQAMLWMGKNIKGLDTSSSENTKEAY